MLLIQYVTLRHPPLPKISFLWGIWTPPSNTWFHPTHHANGILIESAVFPEFTVVTDRQTKRPRNSTCSNNFVAWNSSSVSQWCAGGGVMASRRLGSSTDRLQRRSRHHPSPSSTSRTTDSRLLHRGSTTTSRPPAPAGTSQRRGVRTSDR